VSLRVVQTPESLADIALQADYYARKENIPLAQRFTDAVKTTVQLLGSHPWIGKETDYTHPSSPKFGCSRYGNHSTSISFSTAFAATPSTSCASFTVCATSLAACLIRRARNSFSPYNFLRLR